MTSVASPKDAKRVDDLTLGVELEFAVVNDPDLNLSYESPFVVVESYPKGKQWTNHTHLGHGNLVKLIEDVSSGFIRVGYDATVAPKPDGFECYSQPGPLVEQLQAWGAFFESDIVRYMSVDVEGKTPGGQPKSCGMHVHLSGSGLTAVTLANMIMFVNRVENSPFVEYVAGRYNDYYSKVNPHYTFEKALSLYHAPDCTGSRPGKKIHPTEGGLYKGVNQYKGAWCCPHAEEFTHQKELGYWVRGALWVLPGQHGGKTGDCEFRLFRSTTDKDRFLANLELVHALTKYCHSTGPKETNYKAFCEWLMSPLNTKRRVRYRHLFKHLREGEYVSGLIPRRSKATDGGTA
jgi:hypothetical protein